MDKDTLTHRLRLFNSELEDRKRRASGKGKEDEYLGKDERRGIAPAVRPA